MSWSVPERLQGLDPVAVRRDHRVSLVAGATIVLYTDGLVERRGESLDVGLEPLRADAADLSRLPDDNICDALLMHTDRARRRHRPAGRTTRRDRP